MTVQASSEYSSEHQVERRESESNCDNCVSQADLNRFDRLKWITLGLLFLAPLLLWMLSNLTWPPTAPGAATPDPALDGINNNLAKISDTLIALQAQDQIQGQGQHIDVDVNIHGLAIETPHASTDKEPVKEVITKTIEVEVTRIVTRIVPMTPTITPPPTLTLSPSITPTEHTTKTIVIVKTVVHGPPPPTYVPKAGHACTRFNFEVGRNRDTGSLEPGMYVMRETSGRVVTTWQAQKGWTDSGWQRSFEISADSVHVGVRFYPDSGGYPIDMEIVNPASGTNFGWLTNGLCHAIEIQFPEG